MTEAYGEFIADRDVDYQDGPYYEDEAYDAWRTQYNAYLDDQYNIWLETEEIPDYEDEDYGREYDPDDDRF